jgi:hypothetical protein
MKTIEEINEFMRSVGVTAPVRAKKALERMGFKDLERIEWKKGPFLLGDFLEWLFADDEDSEEESERTADINPGDVVVTIDKDEQEVYKTVRYVFYDEEEGEHMLAFTDLTWDYASDVAKCAVQGTERFNMEDALRRTMD